MMSSNYFFDILNIYKVEHKYVLLLSGWCVNKDKGVPQISIEINGAGPNLNYYPVNRVDVCRSFQLDESKFSKCGFRVRKEFDDKLQSFKVLAKFNDYSEVLFSKEGPGLDKWIQNSNIVYDIEEVTKGKDSETYNFRGWCFSLDNQSVDLKVIDSNENTVDAVIRNTIREDMIALSSSVRGFSGSFHYIDNIEYSLELSTKDNQIKISFDAFLKSKSFSISSFIKKINFDNIKKAFHYFNESGLKNTLSIIFKRNQNENTYQNWFDRHKVTKEELNRQKTVSFAYSPCISILVPTYNTPSKLLREMIDSVRNQSYVNWQLCIADGSNQAETKKIIQDYASKDERIKVSWLSENYGISGNTNKALELATGEYTALFDHDDLLEPDALFEVVQSLQGVQHDIVYTDEDKLNEQTGMLMDPSLKPDWSPDLFLSHNYITHLFVVKTDIIRSIGGFRSEYDGAQDYDLMFRCIEKSKDIYHLPKVLYHWRIHEGSTAGDPESKAYAFEAGRKAIQSHLDRMGIEGKAITLGKPLWGLYRVEYAMKEEPLVSIIIPNYEHEEVLKTCIDSLFNVNTYKNFEIIVVENNSKSKSTFEYYEQVQKEHDNVRVVTWNGTEFNFSAINNFGVKYAKGEYILLLNNDTEMIEPDSLRELLSNCMRDEVGIVGAKLLYDDDSIQHAGVVIGFSGYAGHVFTGIMSKYEYGYMMRAAITCDYSAVTAACLMTKKSIWEQVGGLDESFKVACNDIDYCLKVRDLNQLVVYDAFSVWHHYESKSRGYEDNPEKKARYEDEVARWQKKWGKYLPNNDPYYNKNFAIEKGPYILD